MSGSQLDLDACAREPIHVPGAIQPHGSVLVLDPADLNILWASANFQELIGQTPIGFHPMIKTTLHCWRAAGRFSHQRPEDMTETLPTLLVIPTGRPNGTLPAACKEAATRR